MAVHTSSVCVCVYGSKFSVAYTCFSEFELIENFRPLKPVLKNGCFYAEVSTTDFCRWAVTIYSLKNIQDYGKNSNFRDCLF